MHVEERCLAFGKPEVPWIRVKLDPRDRNNTILRNVKTYSPDVTESHPRRPEYSVTPL
jgi:hypothetical protein